LCLLYHRFAEPADYAKLQGKARIYTISTQRFDEQLASLRRRGYHAVSLDQAIAFARGSATLPLPAVLITIDDGCVSVVTLAAPILRRYGMRAALFVTTDPTATVFAESPGDPRLSDETLRGLDPAIFDLGSHGVSHRPLTDMGDEGLAAELCESRAVLERLSGRPITALAIPGNWYDARVLRAATATYLAVFTSDIGAIRPGADPRRLPRLNVSGTWNQERFERMLSPSAIARRRLLQRFAPFRIGPREP
jgi:peptidoglycan/xylan/chitin deacetylase (PgdA/CDA1 family)